ncbi:MAG: 5-methyltetrahydropteroyltriglutamate--homocysteine S-methyltransferase [Bacillota bacterium]
MIKTSVVGYPRIGEKRELKKLVEDYFAGEKSSEQLEKEAGKLRKRHWQIQLEAGIDYIPAGDFSLYDNMLDTAVMLDVIPARFRELNLDFHEGYFALARGYQDEERDVGALGMKKWFNTNYHYFVPEIDEDTEFSLVDEKVIDEYLEAQDEGIIATPTVIGPLSFLRLSRIKGNKNYTGYLGELAEVYGELLERLTVAGADLVQVEEPYLVTDLTMEEVKSFRILYEKILEGNSRVLLQTYFGDIRDIYEEVMELPFAAVGLDFCEGEANFDLVKKHGFPADRLLFAGVINGRNVWRNDYHKTLSLLDELSKKVERDSIVVGTSCSLLHVPHTLDFEEQMPEKYRRHLAFAAEKLEELSEISMLFSAEKYHKLPEYRRNRKIINDKSTSDEFQNMEVRRSRAGLNEEDFQRDTSYQERLKKQHKKLDLPLLPVTTIGSFPQTSEVREIRSKYRRGELSEEAYREKIQKKIKEVIKLQEQLGLDVLVHGEFERNDMVEYFGQNMDGFIFTENGWVQSYGTRGVKPPIIFGDIDRGSPITVEWIDYARGLTDRPMKGMLTGPVTIYNWSFPREDLPAKEVVFQLALAIKQEIEDLEEAGVEIIQVDEAALREKLPLRKDDWHKDYLDWAIKAFRLATSGVRPETQIHTHMCYSEFSDIIDEIKEMDADVITFEAARSNFALLDILEEKYDREVGPGVYDIHSPRIPPREEFVEKIGLIVEKLDPERVWINPDCGLKTRKFAEVEPALENMVKAAEEVREVLE